MGKKLLDCGICGSTIKVSRRKYKKWENGEVVIYCDKCWAQGGASHG